MKTKELIKRLEELDPSGNLEVTVGKTPIHFVETLPAYYDGNLQILLHDARKAPYYDICGGVITDKGNHVSIHTLSIRDAIIEDADLKVIYDQQSPERIARYRAEVEDWRYESKEITKNVEEYMKNKTV